MLIIHIMFGMIESANTGVRTGWQIRRAGSAAIMILIVGRRIIMMERRVVVNGIPIMKNAPPRSGREYR